MPLGERQEIRGTGGMKMKVDTTKPPKGWVKTYGVTAPNGYDWYSNGESRFSGKRKIALVKKQEE